MTVRLRFVALVCLALGALRPVPVWAQSTQASQETSDVQEEGRFRFGPLRFTPSILVSNLGVDNNVFNEDVNPKQDTTAAIGPAVNLYMNLGHSKLTSKVSGQYLYFSTYQNQRAWNTSDEAKWELRLARLTPFIAGSYANTKERPGYEIDSRARMRTDSVSLGTALELSGKTSVVLSASRSHLKFDEGQLFLGVDLSNALNRTTDTEEIQVRYKLTTLTTFVLNADALQDRFTFDPLRDSRSIKVLPGFELKPSALISGRVFVGYRQFSASNQSLPDYQGAIASVDAKYIVGPTRFGVKVSRDLQYSYEPTEPYYALTDLGLTITERVTRAWELVAQGGWQGLAYQPLRSAVFVPGRTDTIREYGGGIGYRFSSTMRVGFDAIYYQRRSSQVELRDFNGLRFGASVSYGLPQ